MSELELEIENTAHEDVELLLNSEPQDALELIAEDPKYYLNLVETYRTKRDGTEVHLPYCLNVGVTRGGGHLSIKFKLSPTSRWYEVGYTDGDEDSTYKAFTQKVQDLLRFPPPERAHLIEASLEDPPLEGATPSNLKIEIPEPVPKPESGGSVNSTDAPTFFPPEPPVSVLDYIFKLIELQPLCRPEKREAYGRLIQLLSSPDPFIIQQLNGLPSASPPQQICVLHFLRDYTI
jgi:hypothetical protein